MLFIVVLWVFGFQLSESDILLSNYSSTPSLLLGTGKRYAMLVNARPSYAAQSNKKDGFTMMPKRSGAVIEDLAESWVDYTNEAIPSLMYPPFGAPLFTPSAIDSSYPRGLLSSFHIDAFGRESLSSFDVPNSAEARFRSNKNPFSSVLVSENVANSDYKSSKSRAQHSSGDKETLRKVSSKESNSKASSDSKKSVKLDEHNKRRNSSKTKSNLNAQYLYSHKNRKKRRKSKNNADRSRENPFGPFAFNDESYFNYAEEENMPYYTYNPSETPKCARVTNETFCSEDDEYPVETIQFEINEESSIMDQMMPEAHEINDRLVDGISRTDDEKFNWRHYFTNRMSEFSDIYNDTYASIDGRRASFGVKPDYYKDGGYICPSSVAYIYPRRAMNTEGLWKVIVNLRERYKGKDYKQSIRVERCLYPRMECSFTSKFYNSQCIQKYNNHRLLAWTIEKGIHTDIFRFPISCSCFFRGKA